MKIPCEHEWINCDQRICTSDLHNLHCKLCGKHKFVLARKD